jgi:hypothetical protein
VFNSSKLAGFVHRVGETRNILVVDNRLRYLALNYRVGGTGAGMQTRKMLVVSGGLQDNLRSSSTGVRP